MPPHAANTDRDAVPAVVVASVPRSRPGLARLLPSESGRPVRWLFIGDNLHIQRRLRVWGSELGEELDLQPLLHHVTTELRQPYIEYIGVLSRAYQSERWWSTCVAEKNPYVSRTFYFVCCVQACRRLLEQQRPHGTVLLLIEDAALRRTLARALFRLEGMTLVESALGERLQEWVTAALGVGRAIRFVLMGLYRVCLARYIYQLRRSSEVTRAIRNRVPVTLVHTWVDERAFEPATNQVRDTDFSELTGYLRSRGKTAFTVPRILSVVPFRRVARSLAAAPNGFLLPDAFLGPTDVLSAAVRGMLPPDKGDRYPPFSGIDVSLLLADDLRRERRHQRVASVMLFAACVRRLKEAGLIVERMIYTFENHTWERLLCLNMRRYFPHVRLIAHQPNGISKFILNHFIADCETEIAPLPDRIVTTGAYPGRLLSASGYGHARVVIGGALRQRQVLDRATFRTAPPAPRGERPTILVATSLGSEEAAELVLKSIEAFGRDLRYRVLLKCHPSMPYGRIMKNLGLSSLPPQFEVTQGPLEALLAEADVLVYDTTSLCIIALAFGVPSVHVEPETRLDYDHLEFAAHLRLTARRPDEIREAVARLIADGPPSARRAAEYRQALAVMYAPVDERVLEMFLGH